MGLFIVVRSRRKVASHGHQSFGLAGQQLSIGRRNTSILAATSCSWNIAQRRRWATSSSHRWCPACSRGTPNCPGVVFLPSSRKCGIIDPFRLRQLPINRANEHMVVRLGFLATGRGTDALVKASAGVKVFTPELAEKIIRGNLLATKYSAAVPPHDPIWHWIDSVSKDVTAQGASFRKSFFSLGFPVHPHVPKHLRFLKSYFETKLNESVAQYADLFLAIAEKYRYLPSITNSTTTGAHHKTSAFKDVNGVGQCASFLSADPNWVSPMDSAGLAHLPSERTPNPSPLGAVDWLLRKGFANTTDGEYSISTAPWPLLMKLGTAQFPTDECEWMRENEAFAPVKGPAYTENYDHPKKVCKPSNWHVDSLPRIAEDGRMCGGLAYYRVGERSCKGFPASAAVQPMHGANIEYRTQPNGKWSRMLGSTPTVLT